MLMPLSLSQSPKLDKRNLADGQAELETATIW
jgi:hypothetical protein